MEMKFTPDDDTMLQAKAVEEKKKTGRPMLLLIPVVLIGCIYLFSGLPGSLTGQKGSAPQVVRKQLPAGGEAKEPAAGADVKPAGGGKAPVTAAPPAGPAPAPAAGAVAPRSGEEKAVQQPGAVKTVPAVKEVKGVGQTGVAAVDAVQAKDAAAKDAAAGIRRLSVMVGTYLLEEQLAADLGRVRRAGFEAQVTPGPLKKSRMTRLFLAEFPDRAAAEAEVGRLSQYTSDAFIIDGRGKHTVYAGSYLSEQRAAAEKERLGAAGFNLTERGVGVSIPSKLLTVGPFKEQAQAEDAVKKLKAAGVKAALAP